jgi:hypothetical protein
MGTGVRPANSNVKLHTKAILLMGLYLTSSEEEFRLGYNQVIKAGQKGFLILKRRKWDSFWFLLTWVEVMVEAQFLVGGTYFDIKLIKVN